MSSFYGGPQGKDFEIKKIFDCVSSSDNAISLQQDLLMGKSSPVGVGDFVYVSYGFQSGDNYEIFKEIDLANFKTSFNSSLWIKTYFNSSLTNNYSKILIIDENNNLKFYEEGNKAEGFAYIWLGSTQGETPIIQNGTITTLGPLDPPSIEVDVRDIFKPAYNFSLPRAAKFLTGGTESAIDDNWLGGIEVVFSADTEVAAGDYYIAEQNGFIYEITEVSENVASAEYIAGTAPQIGISNTMVPAYNIDTEEPNAAVTFDKVEYDKEQNKFVIHAKSANIPVITVNAASETGELGPFEQAQVDVQRTIKDDGKEANFYFDFSIPRGARWVTGVSKDQALSLNLKNGDWYFINNKSTSAHGQFYQVVNENATTSGRMLEFKGSLAGTSAKFAAGRSLTIEVNSNNEYEIQSAILDWVDNNLDINKIPTNQITPLAVTVNIIGQIPIVTSYWLTVDTVGENPHWVLTKMVEGTQISITQEKIEGENADSTAYSATYLNAQHEAINEEIKNIKESVVIPDWNENNKDSKAYIQNRTHYIDEDGNHHPLKDQFIPSSIARASQVYEKTEVYTKSETDAKIDEKINNMPSEIDWNENDPSSKSYIKNRTHYEYLKPIEALRFSFQTAENETTGEININSADYYEILLESFYNMDNIFQVIIGDQEYFVEPYIEGGNFEFRTGTFDIEDKKIIVSMTTTYGVLISYSNIPPSTEITICPCSGEIKQLDEKFLNKSNWTNALGEKGYIENRTHYIIYSSLLDQEKTCKINPSSWSGWWNNGGEKFNETNGAIPFIETTEGFPIDDKHIYDLFLNDTLIYQGYFNEYQPENNFGKFTIDNNFNIEISGAGVYIYISEKYKNMPVQPNVFKIIPKKDSFVKKLDSKYLPITITSDDPGVGSELPSGNIVYVYEE